MYVSPSPGFQKPWVISQIADLLWLALMKQVTRHNEPRRYLAY
jgi:hypothetical protein